MAPYNVRMCGPDPNNPTGAVTEILYPNFRKTKRISAETLAANDAQVEILKQKFLHEGEDAMIAFVKELASR